MGPLIPLAAGMAYLAWKKPEEVARLTNQFKKSRVWKVIDAARRVKKLEMILDLGLTVRVNDTEFRQGFRASTGAQSTQ